MKEQLAKEEAEEVAANEADPNLNETHDENCKEFDENEVFEAHEELKGSTEDGTDSE